MKTDKEYPATHSMSTAWYIVDDDGNVGIMHFEDNGPVPIPALGSYDAEDLIYGEVLEKNVQQSPINFSKEQVSDLLGLQYSSIDECDWWFVVIKIDKSRIDDFWRIVNKSKIEIQQCVSEEYGLYLISAYHYVENDKTIKESSPLGKLISEGIIVNVYDTVKLLLWSEDLDIYDKEGIIINNFRRSCPFYLYTQPYSIHNLQYRINTPEHPIRISQIADKHKEKILHIPGRFADKEEIQIAQYFPCYLSSYEDEYLYNQKYSKLISEDGDIKYLVTSYWKFDFYKYCPLAKINECKECDFYRSKCISLPNYTNILKPTVLYIVNPRLNDFKNNTILNQLNNQVIAFSYIPILPKRNCKKYLTKEKDVWHGVDSKMLLDIFRKSNKWLESVVSTICPKVIIIDDDATEVFEDVYPIHNSKVLFYNVEYPIFKKSEFENNKDVIKSLASIPYEGLEAPTSLTIEEVEKLKKQEELYD